MNQDVTNFISPARVKEREEEKRIEKERIRIVTQRKIEDRLGKSSQRKLEFKKKIDSFSQSDGKNRLLTCMSSSECGPKSEIS